MDNEIAKRDFDQLMITHKGNIPETIADGKLIFDSLGDYTNASDWYRAAFVAAYVKRGDAGRPFKDKINLLSSQQITMTAFANKKIRGLSSRNAVQHYLEAWETTGKDTPVPGQVVNLPSHPFPAWGTIIGLGGLKSSESVE